MRGAALLLLVLAPPALAQQVPLEPAPQVAPSPILTVDQEALLRGTLWGKRILAESETAAKALAAENRKIEADLQAEEQALTEARKTLPPDEFRTRADAFDAKVSGIRDAQDAKTRDIDTTQNEARDAFFKAAVPVMGAMLAERGAVAFIDTRAIFLASQSIDVTEALIARIDATLGDGR